MKDAWHRRLQFIRAAKAWQAKNPGSEVWICDNGESFTVSVNGRVITPEAFFAEIGGRFSESPVLRDIPLRFGAEATKRWNCGPIALAAIIGRTPDEIRHHIPDYEKRGGINLRDAKAALLSLGFLWKDIGKNWPQYGLASLKLADRRHLICASVKENRRYVLDNNTIGKGWVDLEEWLRLVVRGRDWSITEAIEVTD